jgi:anti-sigma28 factor (negative regulator of flagellin synthesis)
MPEFIMQKWQKFWGHNLAAEPDRHEKLLITLHNMVENCSDGAGDQAPLPLMSNRLQAIECAAREGRYEIQPERIAERLLAAAI